MPRDVTSVLAPVPSRGATAIAQGARSSAHPTIPAKQLQRGVQFSRLQSFTNVQAPTLARPPGCSHRRKLFLGDQAVYTAHNPVGYLPRVAVSLHARHGQLAWLDSHQLECSLVGCSRTRWTTNEFHGVIAALQFPSTSRAWSHCAAYPLLWPRRRVGWPCYPRWVRVWQTGFAETARR